MKYLYTREEAIAKIKAWRDSQHQLASIRTILDDVLDVLEASEDKTRDQHFARDSAAR